MSSLVTLASDMKSSASKARRAQLLMDNKLTYYGQDILDLVFVGIEHVLSEHQSHILLL